MGNILGCCVPDPDASTPDNKRIQEKGQLIRFFMTGLGSAGKTTIVRQLFLLSNKNSNYKVCNENWDEEKTKPEDNELWVMTIRKNILDSMDIFVKQIKINETPFADEEDTKFADMIEDVCEQGDEGIEDLEIDEEFLRKLLKLFNSEEVQNVWKKRNTINVEGKKLFDGCDHFLKAEKITEIFDKDYIASDADKVHSRKPTVDMSTYRFKINSTRIEINDVGGQRSELIKIVDYLSKWSFEARDPQSNFILLVVSMSDFNVKHEEYEGTLLDECLEYMKILMNNKVAQNCGLFIFFNKKDRFKEKLQDPDCRENVSYLAPFLTAKQVQDYQQRGKFNEKDMQKALSDKFTEVINTFKDRERRTYCRYTCAVDSKMMEGLFSAIKDDFLQSNLIEILP